MAESYDIHLTDPLSAAFKVRAFTSNGTIFPTSSSLNSTAVGAETSLLIFGKGHPEYGERINEDILHVLENFSGSTEPKNPVSGQLWYERFTVVRTGGLFYVWTDGVGWAGFTPSLVTLPITDGSVNDGDYWLDGSDLYLAVKDASHPLSPTWLPRVFEDRTGAIGGLLPRKVLKVYTGIEWKTVDSVHVSEIAPTSPTTGDLWYDNTVPQLKIYDGSSFVSVADRYLQHDGSIAMTGALDMGTNLINNVVDPVSAQDAATRGWVLTVTGSLPTTLDALVDVNVPSPTDGNFLKFNAAGPNLWEDAALALTDFGVTASPAELNFSTGVTSAIQTQIDGKFDKTGGPISAGVSINGILDMLSHNVNNITMDGSLTGAATKDYVDTAVSSPSLTLDDLTDVAYTGGSPAVVPVLGQVLEFDGLNWANSDYVHSHDSADVIHTTTLNVLRDFAPGSYPDVPLNTVIESTVNNFSQRLNKLDDFARREIFVVAGSPLTNTDFVFTDGTYRVGSNRLNVFVNGVKQYASERARQSIKFSIGQNLSSTALLGTVSVAGSPPTPTDYDLRVAVDGAPATVITLSLDETSTIADLVSQLNVQLVKGSPSVPSANAVWSKTDNAIHIFSATTGNGSSIEINEGTLNGLLTGLTSVALGSPPADGLPVLSYGGSPDTTTIYPAFPSNVTQITADLAYEEVDNSFDSTTFGFNSSSIKFNSTLPVGAVVEMISEATSDLIN